MRTLYIVILNTPNDHPTWRLVGVFTDFQRAHAAGQYEVKETGNDSSYVVTKDDGKDVEW